MLPKGSNGMIDLVLGPMFAGKSTELLRRIKRYRVASKKCLVIKYANDIRYSETWVSTHDQQMIEAVSCEMLSEVEQKAQKYDIIGIDEGQFFDDIVEFWETMANSGKMVIVAALDGTFERKAFGRVLELIPLWETITKLDSVCVDCKNSASFTKRLCDSKETELIGGSDIYKPVWRGCYNKVEALEHTQDVSEYKESRDADKSIKFTGFEENHNVKNCTHEANFFKYTVNKENRDVNMDIDVKPLKSYQNSLSDIDETKENSMPLTQ